MISTDTMFSSFRVALLLIGVALLSGTIAVAQTPLPSFEKTFDPATIGPGSTSMLVFEIMNPSASPVTGLAFTDVLPAGLVIADAPGISNSCDGTLSAPAGGTTISLTGGDVAGSSTCTIVVHVTDASGSPGTRTNTTGDLTSSEGNSGTATADLVVATDRPGFSKSFSPGTVDFGGTSTLTFTIDNSANASAEAFLSFSDELPAGMVIADPANATNTCKASDALVLSFTAEPGTNFIEYNYFGTGAFPGVPAMGTCTITVDVVGNAVGELGNVSRVLDTSSGESGKAAATLEVTGFGGALITLLKEFTDDPVPPGGTTTLKFSITNRDRSEAALDIAFSDDLDATLTGLVATGLPLTGICNGTGTVSTTDGGSTIDFSGGSLGPGETCMFEVSLSVPSAAASGMYPNTTTDITATIGGSPETGPPASGTLFVEPAPILTKEFTDDPVGAGNDVTMEFTITNTSDTFSASDIAFDDNLSAFLSGIEPSDVTLPSPGFCGGGASAGLFIDTDDLFLEITNASLAPSASCTFSVTLSVPEGTAGGNFVNRTERIMATVDGDTVIGKRATDVLEVIGGPSLSKQFTNDPVEPGSTVDLEFTLSLDDFAPGDATGISFSDDLDATLSGLVATGLPISACDGTLSTSDGGMTIDFTGGTLMPGEDCTFTVTLDVPSDAAGIYPNETSDVSAMVTGIAVIGRPAMDDLVVSPLRFTKEFIDDPVIPGDEVTLRFAFENLSTTTDATNLFFTDNLGGVLSGLAATGTPVSGCGGTLSGTSNLTFSGGSVAAGTMCSFDVTVVVPMSADDGSYSNVTSNLLASFDGGGSTAVLPPAQDNLDVNATLLDLVKAFTDDPTAPGDMVTLEFTLTNLDPDREAVDVAFTDDLDAALSGLALNTVAFNDCGATISGTTTISVSGGTLLAGASCTIALTLDVPAGASDGFYTNTTSEVSGIIADFPVRGEPAEDILEVNSTDFSFTKSFTDDPAAAGGTVTLSFTIQNLNDTGTFSDLSFSDDLDATLSGLAPSAGQVPATVCNGGTLDFSGGLLTFDGGSLGPAASCMFSVVLDVPAGATPGVYPNTTSELFDNGIPVREPATDNLTVFGPPGFSKAFAPDRIMPGDLSLLTFTIDNTANPVDATGLDFTDNLPAGLVVATPSNASTDCTGGTLTAADGSGTISYTGGSVAAGASCTVTVEVTGDMIGDFDNVSGDLTSSLGNSGPATDTLTIAAPDFAITKDDGDVTVEPGDTITYTITYDNNGNEDGSNVTITDTVPTGTTFDAGASTAGWSCADNDPAGTVCTFSVGTLAAGSTGNTVTFAVTVDNPLAAGIDEVENTASITDDGANGIDPNPADNTDSDTTPVDAEPDLAIEKDDGDVTVEPGDTITYTITYTNNGNQGATGVTLTDTVPEGTTFDAVSSTPGWSCADGDPAGTVCTFDAGSLPGGGASGSVTFVVTVDNPIAAGIDEIENTASIADDGANGDDPNTDDNTDSDTTPVDAEPDLAIEKDDDDLTAQPGDTIPYILTYTNNGNQGATGVALTDTVPEGTTFDADASTPGWSCVDGAPAGTACTYTVAGEVAGGGTGMVTFAVVVDNPIAAGLEEVENTASVEDDGTNGDDPNLDDNTDSDTTPIEAAPEISATKTDTLTGDQDGDGNTDPGDTLTYLIVVSNDGDQDVADVIVTDTVDPLLDLDCGSLTPGQGTVVSCTPGPGGSFTVDLTEIDGEPRLLAPEATAGITFSATVVVPFPATEDEVANQATVTYTGETGTEEVVSDDPDTARPRDPTVTPIDLEADLELTKTASTTTPNFGTQVTFTLTVVNKGPVDVVTNVEVRDVLPSGLIFVSAEGDGDYNPDTGIWDLDGVALGVPETLEITVIVDGLNPITNNAEVLRAGLPDPDSVPGDGQGDDFDSVTLTPIAADLELSKRLTSRVESADGTTVKGTFALTLTNEGPSPATGVEVMEFFAGEMTFVSASPAGAFNPATSTWTVGTLAVGASTTLSITVTAPIGGTVINLAEVSAVNETDPDSTPLDGRGDDFAGAALNRGGPVTFPALAADLSITKAVSQSQPILGEQITYLITVSNAGPFTTAGVMVTDLLPEGLAFVSASASSDDEGCDPCSYDAATGIWDIGKLIDGETATLEIVVEVTAEGEISNTARITQHYLPDPDSDISIDNPAEDDVATAIATVASGKATSIVRSGGEGIPETFEMGQNYPNPFNPQTTIPFGVPEAGRVVVAVYNLLGQRVAVLMDQELAAGRHEVVWQALDQPTGMYLVRLVAGETTLTKRVTLVK